MTRRVLADVTRRVARRRAYTAALREHDAAMSDRRVALEHSEAIRRAQLRGEPGCTFCS
jgi:hypothetical protein